MVRFGVVELLMLPLTLGIPLLLLYFIIKLAVKNAVKELKKEENL